MKNFPDILGLELDLGKALLESEGLAFHIVETKPARPPRDVYSHSKMRIIKVEQQADIVVVTVCKI